MRINVRRLEQSWQYDFKPPGHPRQRKGGFRTKAAALAAGEERYDALLNGKQQTMLADAYRDYLDGTTLANRTRDSNTHLWTRIGPVLGHVFVEDVSTAALDAFKRTLPDHLGPKSVNQHLILISAVLRFAWKRGKLKAPPYIPRVKVPKKAPEWYSEQERDRLLAGMFELQPRWYLFFYLSVRLGLRLGEVYALTREQIRDIPPQLVIDRAAERGTKTRPAAIKPRKNNEALVLSVPEDVMDAIRWHIAQGYAGPAFLFCQGPTLPRYIDSHCRPLLAVQRALGLRLLSHHKIGRHSVGGQAMTAGMSTRMLQAQLGHRSPQSTAQYANLAPSAQLRLVEALTPVAPPHVNDVSTGKKKGT